MNDGNKASIEWQNSRLVRQAAERLNPRQLAFVNAYIASSDSTAAYIEVYKPEKNKKHAASAGARLLANTNVQRYLNAQRRVIENKAVKSALETCEWLCSVIDDEQVSMGYRLKSVELLARIRGWYNEPPQIVFNSDNGGENKTIVNIIGVDNATNKRAAA